MSTIATPLAPRLTRMGGGREHNAVAPGAKPEQAGDASVPAPQGDGSGALVEQAALGVRQTATLAAISLLVAAVVGGAAVALSRRAARAHAPKS